MNCVYCGTIPHRRHCLEYRDPLPPPPPPASPGTPVPAAASGDTRVAAFREADRETAQERVFALVSSRGEGGITCDEAEAETEGLHQSISPAFHALARKRRIRDSGRRRPTRTGRLAIVWVLAGGL